MGTAGGGGGGDSLLPPDKRPSIKDTRQSWGLRLLPIVMEGRRETKAGDKMDYTSLCCLFGSMSKETSDLGLITLFPCPPQPPAFYAICVLAPVANPTHPNPHHFPECPRWEGPHRAASQGNKNCISPTLSCPRSRTDPSIPPLSSSSSPVIPDHPLRNEKKGQLTPC